MDKEDILNVFDEDYYYEYTSEINTRIKALYDLVRERELREKQRVIDCQNSRRKTPIEIPPNTKIYLKQLPRSKLAPLYREEDLEEDQGDKVKTQKGKVYHKQEVKPIRKSKH